MCQNTMKKFEWNRYSFESSECIIIVIITEPTDLTRLDQNRIICSTGGVRINKKLWK